MNAFILAAGLGTRLKPLTDTMPKAMVPVAGKPLIFHLINRLKEAGVENIVVNIHHFAQQIVDYVNKNNSFGLNILFSDETDQLLETGGAIKKAVSLFPDNEPFLVHNVDVFHNLDLRSLYNKYAHAADAILFVSDRITSRYLLFNQENRLVGWTNLKTGEVKSPFEEVRANPAGYSRLAFSGIHIFSPGLAALMDSWPDRFSVIDFYLDACAAKRILGVNIPDLRLLDVGKLDTITEAEEFLVNM